MHPFATRWIYKEMQAKHGGLAVASNANPSAVWLLQEGPSPQPLQGLGAALWFSSAPALDLFTCSALPWNALPTNPCVAPSFSAPLSPPESPSFILPPKGGSQTATSPSIHHLFSFLHLDNVLVQNYPTY